MSDNDFKAVEEINALNKTLKDSGQDGLTHNQQIDILKKYGVNYIYNGYGLFMVGDACRINGTNEILTVSSITSQDYVKCVYFDKNGLLQNIELKSSLLRYVEG
jgi:hypothetical protein